MAYNSVVVTREVLDTRDLIGDLLDGDKIKESLLSTRFEPEDLNALEMALKIKDEHGGTVTAFSIGDSQGIDVLRECLYRGIDDVIRISCDQELDSHSSAKVLAAAIKKLGEYDLVFTGVNVSEGETALLGTMLAENLDADHVSYVDNLEEITETALKSKRAVEMGYEIVETKLPAVISVGVALLQEDPRTPRSAKAMLKLKKKKIPITEWSLTDLGLEEPLTQTIVVASREAIPQKEIRSKSVDPQSTPELKAMLDEVTKGA